ncbi:MAG: hypothetical protein E7637_01070 [Ruminococcaceae bacterium]|nr:hypothetical protein [Oscillospiraceae bacterium]
MTDHENQNRQNGSPQQNAASQPENVLDDFAPVRARAADSSVHHAEPKKAEQPKKAERPAPTDKKTGASPSTGGKAPASKKATPPKSAPEKSVKSRSSAKAPKSAAQASTASPISAKMKNQSVKKEQEQNPNLRSSRPAHKVIPYVFLFLAIFIGISLLLNLLCNRDNQLENTPSKHWMGIVGYYVCYFFFGLFGPAVFVLPLLLAALSIYWKKYVDNSIATPKILVSTLFLLMLGAIIHVFCLQSLGTPTDFNYTAGELMVHGAEMTGGGVFGGKLGYAMVKYLNVVGSLIVGFFLLGCSLFYVLGMTPEIIWNFFRARRKARRQQLAEKQRQQRAVAHEQGLSQKEAEEAHLQAKMDEKIRRMTAKQGSADKNEAIEVVRPAPQKKTEADKLAPMPMPRLDPTDGTRPFVPGDVGKRINEANRAGAAAEQKPPVQQTPAPAAQQPTAQIPLNSAQNRDTAVDPIFPKNNEAKLARRVPRQDRNFDLNKVFLDLGDTERDLGPQHAPIPPEVPLNATAQANAARATAAKRPVVSGATPKTAVPKKPSSASQQPVFGQAKPQETDFGLSNEQFEALEAQGGSGVNAKNAAVAVKASQPKETKAQASAAKEPKPKTEETKKYVFPPISYLQPGQPMTAENRAEIDANMTLLSETLKSFNVGVRAINFSCGPTVTRYEVILAPGVRVRSITNLADDIALSLRSPGGVRIEAPIPGTNAVGIEIPNKTRSTIYLRDLIESQKFAESTSKLSACLGADIAGEPLIFDIAKMPHLLVAGTTGSGKSVCINCIIMSLLYRVRPDEVKLILIDPKKVEFSIYKNIPHLMAPVVTLPKDAAGALQAAVEEMERRFEIFESVGVRDLKGYNTITANDPDMPYIPHIVIIIDELADLMMTAKNEVETAICRIAQKARAAGMHLIIGTQRPSADVVTGLIKANVPSSIAFAVKSQIDSRVILDHGGAEALTGRGDMLFVPIGSMRDTRVQGAFVDDKEVEKICEFIRANNGTAQYDERFTSKLKELAAQCGNKGKPADEPAPVDGDDPKYNDAVRVAVEEGRISTSLLQRKLGVGYGRAAKLIDRMQLDGIVSPPDGSKPRSILITPEQYLERFVDNAENTANTDGES